MALPIIPILTLIKSGWDSWMKIKEIKNKGKQKVIEAKIEAKVRRIDNMYTMDSNAANDMKHSWKDEYLTILMSVPVIMSFIPKLSIYVAQGFVVLQNTPEWYRIAFLGIIAATFGLRAWFNKR